MGILAAELGESPQLIALEHDLPPHTAKAVESMGRKVTPKEDWKFNNGVPRA